MNEIKIVKVINKDKTYVDKKGKERVAVNYYVASGDTWIPIRCPFSKGYVQLDMLAQTIVNNKNE